MAKTDSRKKPKTTQSLRKKSGAKLAKTRPHHHGDLKQSLVRLAVEFLAEASVNDLSLRELARRAGVSQAAPYRHFTDKDQLLAAIAADGFRKLGDLIQQAMAEYPDSISEQYHQTAYGYFKMGIVFPEHFKLMSGSTVSFDAFFTHRELYLAAQRAFFSLVKQILNCQKSGLMGQGCPIRRALHCWVTVHGFTTLYSLGRIHWLAVDEAHSQAALRGVMQSVLAASRLADSELDIPFTPQTTPTPLSVIKDVGIDLNDVAEGKIMVFDDSLDWPELDVFEKT